LGHGTRKTVQDVPAGASIVLIKSLTNDLDHDFIAYETAGFDDLLGGPTEF
jgi:hypothetical protein